MSSDWSSLYGGYGQPYPWSLGQTVGGIADVIGGTIRQARTERQARFDRGWQIFQQLPPQMQTQYYPALRKLAESAGITNLPAEYTAPPDPQVAVMAAKRLDMGMRALESNPRLRDSPEFMAQMRQDYEAAYGRAPTMVPQQTTRPGEPERPEGVSPQRRDMRPGPDVTATEQVPFFATSSSAPGSFGEILSRTPQGRQFAERISAAGGGVLLETPIIDASKDLPALVKDAQGFITNAAAGQRASEQDKLGHLTRQVKGVIAAGGPEMIRRLQTVGAQSGLDPNEWAGIVTDVAQQLDKDRLYHVRINGQDFTLPGPAASQIALWVLQNSGAGTLDPATRRSYQSKITALEADAAKLQARYNTIVSELKNVQQSFTPQEKAIAQKQGWQAVLWLRAARDPALAARMKEFTNMDTQIAGVNAEIEVYKHKLEAPAGATSDAGAPQPPADGGTPPPSTKPTPTLAVQSALYTAQSQGRGAMMAQLKKFWPRMPQDIRKAIIEDPSLKLTEDEKKRLEAPAKPETPAAGAGPTPPAPGTPPAADPAATGAETRAAERASEGAQEEIPPVGGGELAPAIGAVRRRVESVAKTPAPTADEQIEGALRVTDLRGVPRILKQYWKRLSPQKRQDIIRRYKLKPNMIAALAR
jgi:hypothetical protein